ncbi:MAG TPA: FlgD immunoglobulin-like domain containing protein, partial [Patescibacteria group bacterium]|nr:FlgD immunoglobulin-like domain containing protein [Patescibacteria group bacterium]
SFGLQKVAGLQFPDIAGQPSMMLCDGEYLYIAGGDRIKKVDITDPYNSDGLCCYAVESAGDHLYVEFGESLEIVGYSEIILPTVMVPDEAVYFSVVCTDHDAPVCFDHELELVSRQNPVSFSSLRGNPVAYYSVGKSNDSTFVVFNTIDPTDPVPLKVFESPWSRFWVDDDPLYGEYWLTMNRAYAFDDQYLFVGMQRSTSVPFSSVYVFDLYSPEPEPVYALGDMELGQYKNGSLASWGKFLYYCDQVNDSPDYYQLQVFEKATGCDAAMNMAIGPDPIADAYEVGQNVIISWTCTGCPIRVHITLVEDINHTQTIAVLRKFDEPDLSANSITWQAEGISSDPDNHTYRISIMVTNIEGVDDYCVSQDFSIQEELGTGKGGQVPILGFGTDGGEEREYPLPGLTALPSWEHQWSYWLFPVDPAVRGGEISLTVGGCRGSVTHLSAMEMISVDAPEEYRLVMMNSIPVLSGDGEAYLGVDLLLGEEAGATGRSDDGLSIEKLPCVEAGGTVEIRSNEHVTFTYRVPGTKEGAKRYYVLRYGGRLVVSGGEGEEDVPRVSRVGVRIYDVAGRLVRTLWDDTCKPGIYTHTWDGRNSNGHPVSGGVYFCRLTFDGGSEEITRKLVLLH